METLRLGEAIMNLQNIVIKKLKDASVYLDPAFIDEIHNQYTQQSSLNLNAVYFYIDPSIFVEIFYETHSDISFIAGTYWYKGVTEIILSSVYFGFCQNRLTC